MKVAGAALLIILIFITNTVLAEQFGHIAVMVDDSLTADLQNVKIGFEERTDHRLLNESGLTLLWNIHPGRHTVQLLFPDNRKARSTEVIVFPGLTSRVDILTENESLILKSNGFADQAGHVFIFDRDEIEAIPGNLNDGIGLFTGGIIDSRGYSYGNLPLQEKSMGRMFNPSGKSYFDYALVNLSDPLAGYDNADISLISNFDGPERIGLEGVYASRDRRFYRISAARALPRNIGSFYSALNFENLDDAAPRWNSDGVLPHNDAENIEILGGAGLNINSRIKSDLRFIYKRNQRNLYIHSYYFNLVHAPREEYDHFDGRWSFYGWLNEQFFARVGFGMYSDEYKKGDGTHFDNVESYSRPYGNPTFDESGLFWSWDDINGETETIYDYFIDSSYNYTDSVEIYSGWWEYTDSVMFFDTTSDRKYILSGDEGHVWGDYRRSKVDGKRLFGEINYDFQNIVRTFLNIDYKMDNYRYYRNLFPEIPFSRSISNIGFDSLGVEITDNNDFAEIPHPKTLNLSLGAQHISRYLSVFGSLDFLRFDPGTPSIKNKLDPFGSNYKLDEDDLTDDNSWSKLGYRFKFILCDLIPLPAGRFDIFSSISKQFTMPAYDQLYFDYSFFEQKVLNFGYYHPMGNVNLKPIVYKQYQVGAQYEFDNNNLTISYSYYNIDNMIDAVNIPADPKAYQTFINLEFGDVHRFTFSFQMNGVSMVKPFFAAEAYKIGGNGYFAGSNSIAWLLSENFAGPYYSSSEIIYSLNGGLNLNLEELADDYDNFIINSLSRLSGSFSFRFLSGGRYTPYENDVDAVTLYNVSYSPAGSINSGDVKDFVEINIGATAKILKMDRFSFLLRFEVMNLLDYKNVESVYPTSGQPDNTTYLDTEQGQEWLDDQSDIDSSGMTRLQKYLLKQNDPNNFGRPRIFRIIARLEF